MVLQVADYRYKRGTVKKRRMREGRKGGVTAGSERQINGRRKEGAIEEGRGRRDQAEAAWTAESGGRQR